MPVLSDSPTALVLAARGDAEDGTPEERAMRWILRLPDCTFFRLNSCPYAPVEAVAAAVDELLGRAYPAVTRYVAGVYRREPSAYSPMYGRDHDIGHAAARIVAPPVGSGLGSYSALLTLGLSNQMPTSTLVAVTDPNASPPADLPPGARHKYVHRDNERRNELTWPEVTLLETVRDAALWEDRKYPLDSLLARVTDLKRQLAVGCEPLVRRDQFRWAADTEKPPFEYRSDGMTRRLTQVLSVLPETLDEQWLRNEHERRVRRASPGWFSRTLERLRWRFSL